MKLYFPCLDFLLRLFSFQAFLFFTRKNINGWQTEVGRQMMLTKSRFESLHRLWDSRSLFIARNPIMAAKSRAVELDTGLVSCIRPSSFSTYLCYSISHKCPWKVSKMVLTFGPLSILKTKGLQLQWLPELDTLLTSTVVNTGFFFISLGLMTYLLFQSLYPLPILIFMHNQENLVIA